MKSNFHPLFKPLVIANLLAVVASSNSVIAQEMGKHADLTFASFPGPYMRSQMLGFVRPYEDQTGTRVFVEHYAGGINEIRDQVESANVVWDVVDLIESDMLRACDEGLLESLGDIELPPGKDGTPAKEDFVSGALHECGVGMIVWATAFAYNNKIFGDNKPEKISDFFDTENFPGPRAIRKDPTVIMEWALIADGVAPNEVYSKLETEDGVEQAFAVMDRIKPGLQLWANGREPVRMLGNSEVVMSSVWATTGAIAAEEPEANFAIGWDGRVIEVELFGIPKGTRNKEAAIEFIKYGSSTESLARMASLHPNGPARSSSLELLPDDVLSRLPNNPNAGDLTTIKSDAVWWSKNHSSLEEAFNAWLAKSSREGASGTVR